MRGATSGQPHARPVRPLATMPSGGVLVALAGVLGLATVLRFTTLSTRGLIYWDESKFSLEGIRIQNALNVILGFHGSFDAGKSIGTAKPTHALFIALAYCLLGVHDYTPLMLDAAASVVEVGVLFLLSRRLFGNGTGLLAALLLAVSEYDAIYARSALSESDANLLFLLGVLLCSSNWLPRPDRDNRTTRIWSSSRLAGAVVLGAGFTTNYRLIVYIAFVVAADLVLLYVRGRWREAGMAGLTWIGGLATFPALWQIAGTIAQTQHLVLYRSEVTWRVSSYVGEALYQLHGGKQAATRFDPLLYPQWYVTRQGWMMLILVLAALATAAVMRSARWLLPTILVVGPFAVYAFAPFIVPRNLDTTLPFSSLLVAALLVGMAGKVPSRIASRLLLGATIVLLTVWGTVLTWRLTGERSGFAEAANYTRSHGSSGALVLNEVMLFYLRGQGGSCHAPRLVSNLDSLGAAYRAGYRYLVLDEYQPPFAQYVRAHARRIRRYRAAGPVSLGENPLASENGYSPAHRGTNYVDVFSVASLHLPAARNTQPPVCTLDHLT